MNLQLQNTDGPSILATLGTSEKKIHIPSILYLQTKRINPPSFAEGILHFIETKKQVEKFSLCIGESTFQNPECICKKQPFLQKYLFYPKDMKPSFHQQSINFSNKNQQGSISFIPAGIEDLSQLSPSEQPTIYAIGSATQLFKKQKDFITFIINLKETTGPNNLLYLPSVAEPMNLALLIYLGIPLFDSSRSILAARNQTLFFPTGNIKKTALNTVPCSCPACKQVSNTKEMQFETILLHNNYQLHHELRLIKHAIQQNTLRELVEQRVRNHPHHASILHLIDINHYPYTEKHTATQTKKKVITTTRDGLFRPEIHRFQKRVIHRFQPPTHAEILLLLPCSARKPYSFSKSHRRIKRVIYSLKNHHCIQEIIITSPLGLVPRELELIYPAASYDISVSGDWYEDEKHMIQQQLNTFLDKHSFNDVILHLPKTLSDIVSEVISSPIYTSADHPPTSNESLTLLSQTLKNIIKTKKMVGAHTRKIENMNALASYQFGSKTASILLKDTKITGKYPYQRIMDENGTQLGMITAERGFISLTLDGTKRIESSKTYWVKISNDFTLKGSVFAPGVIDADSDIRKGDEVIVFQNKKLQGVGVAQMNAETMKRAESGEAVKIRHIVH